METPSSRLSKSMAKRSSNRWPRLLSAFEVVRKFRISYQTLNHYTNLGLLKNATRKGLKRFYREADVKRRLRIIKALQNKGYPLRLIAERLRS